MDIHDLLAVVGEAVGPEDRVLELGAGAGRHTGLLAAAAASVVAYEPSAEAMDRTIDRHTGTPGLRFFSGDGETLDGVDDASVDLVVAHSIFRRVGSAKAVLGFVQEIGRVLAPGGRAVLALSTDPSGGERRESRRDLLRAVSRRPDPPAGAFVPLDAFGAVAVAAGLELDRIEGAGTRDTVALARRP